MNQNHTHQLQDNLKCNQSCEEAGSITQIQKHIQQSTTQHKNNQKSTVTNAWRK